ncbi:MAG: HypC/HybG/HupF family hydrogenase formation chaperone, partial [Thermoanaerobacteraceae bacterium]|nr:HypC/HybG/HupF family hydrogenase formation chaperone [Thermoanaerobacteraceae bacterium]
PNVDIGDYVLVHAGFAIQIIDRKSARENLHLWEQLEF